MVAEPTHGEVAVTQTAPADDLGCLTGPFVSFPLRAVSKVWSGRPRFFAMISVDNPGHSFFLVLPGHRSIRPLTKPQSGAGPDAGCQKVQQYREDEDGKDDPDSDQWVPISWFESWHDCFVSGFVDRHDLKVSLAL